MTPKKLARLIASNLKRNPAGVTLNVATGEAPEPGYFAIGGMIQPYGNFGALYYEPTTSLDIEALETTLRKHWPLIELVGHVGAWRDGDAEDGDLFIDSVYRIECECDTEFIAGRNIAIDLGKQKRQIAIGHVCDRVEDGYETIKLGAGA